MRPHREDAAAHRPPLSYLVLHFLSPSTAATSGGAGMIILASLGLIGLTNIHQMNGLKNYFAITVNFMAIGAFIWKELVDWRIARTMVVSSIIGDCNRFGSGSRNTTTVGYGPSASACSSRFHRGGTTSWATGRATGGGVTRTPPR